MSGNKKRALDSFLQQKRERFDDLSRLSYHDRMRVMEQEWAEQFWLADSNPEKHPRVAMETGSDPSIQNAIFRVNTASQKPSTEQIDSFIREEKQRSKDRFLKLVETIDDLSAKIKEIEPQAMQAFSSAQQLNYFTDLRLGTYDARKDAELIRQHCEAPAAETQTEPTAETKTETQTDAPAETQTQTEVKPETESTKPAAAETQTTETKTENQTPTPDVKTETPAESKPETQTPVETKPAEVKPETQTPVETKPAVKNETPIEVKTETQTTPEVKPEIKPDAAVSVNA